MMQNIYTFHEVILKFFATRSLRGGGGGRLAVLSTKCSEFFTI